VDGSNLVVYRYDNGKFQVKSPSSPSLLRRSGIAPQGWE
jgi:hypothetical protein